MASYIEEKGRENFDSLELRLNKIHCVGRTELADDPKVLHVDAYDLPGPEIGFDIRVEAEIKVSEGNHHYDEAEYPRQWFVLRCTGNLEIDLADFTVMNIDVYNSGDHHENRLCDSLVPVIRRHDYEKAAEDFLRRYYMKSIENFKYVDPMTLARDMDLKVCVRSITADCSIFGQVYFRDCDAELYNSRTGETEMVHVPARTILVDPQAYFLYNLGEVNNTIIHECVHWDLHRKAFELDRLCNKDNDNSMIGCRVVGGMKNRESRACSIMESQANALTPRIQMPMQAFKRRASQRVSEYRKLTGKFDLIDVIEPVIDALAADFGVSRLAAKIRMVEAGYEEAAGTFHWVDGRYVAAYRYKSGSLQENQTFTISAQDLAVQLVTNKKLKDIVADGTYRYVDAHLVLASGKYIREDDNGRTALTDYARNHMDECCLAFDMTVEGCDHEYHTFCYFNKDKNAGIFTQLAYGNGLQHSPPERQKEVLSEYVNHYADLYRSFTTDYVDCLQKAFKDSGMTYKELADDINMNPDTVSRIINGKHKTTEESLALICLGLKLPYKLSNHIFQQSPCNLSYREERYIWIDMALQAMSGQKMSSVKAFLNEHNVFII